jgi:hypothetical protein
MDKDILFKARIRTDKQKLEEDKDGLLNKVD